MLFKKCWTYICSDNKCFHIEHNKNTTNNDKINFIINELENESVFTNIGVDVIDKETTDFTKLSSTLRKKIALHELKTNKVEDYEQLFRIMSKNYKNLNPLFHLYRDGRKTLLQKIIRLFSIEKPPPPVKTLCQLLLNVNKKELIYKYDKEYGLFLGVINKLPKGYNPIIKVRVNPTFKNYTVEYLTLNAKIIKDLYKKYSYTYQDTILLNNIFLSGCFFILFIILFLIGRKYSRFLHLFSFKTPIINAKK